MRALLCCILTAMVLQGQVALASDAILIPFQVNQKNAMVVDLTADEIELRVDGVAQKVSVFEGPRTQPRTVPTEVCILFDCDRTVVANSGLTPRVFHENLLDENDHVRVALYGFGGGLVQLAGPTRDEAVLRKALDAGMFVHPLGTFLLDHIRQLVQEAASSGPAARMLLVVSDGVSDTAGASQLAKRERFDATVLAAQRSSTSLHPVVVKAPFGTQASTSSSAAASGRAGIPRAGAVEDMGVQTDLRSLGDFTNLASATGGQNQEVLGGSGFLPGLLKSVSKLVRDNYVVGFVPVASDPPKRHKIELTLKNKNRGRVIIGVRNLTF